MTGRALTVQSQLAELPLGAGASIDGVIGDDEVVGFELYVPERPDAEAAPGVLVYISPKSGAAIPEDWQSVLDARNLVWVGALDSGNEVDVARRVALALLSPRVAAGQLEIDRNRVYLSGFSGGGRVASMMLPYYPLTFTGALFICGANGASPLQPEQTAAFTNHRLVFLTGSGDFNLLDTELAYHTFVQAGIGQPTMTVVDGLGHALPDAEPLADALDFLTDAP